MHKEDISVQLYTTRKFEPYPPILSFIKDSGLKNIDYKRKKQKSISPIKVPNSYI